MSSKRMFDRDLVNTDRFADLPSESKALYFLIGLDADDEGFVSHRRIMRAHNIPEDAVNVLIAKGFVMPYDTGVIVITDWHTNNYLQRPKATQFQIERSVIEVAEDNVGDARYKVKKYVVKQEHSDIIKDGVINVKHLFNNCLTSVKQPLNNRLTDVQPVEKSREEKRGVERNGDDVASGRKLSFATDDMEMAKKLADHMRKNNPECKLPSSLDVWANEVRLMRERDDRTYKQIDFLIEYSQKDEFWGGVVLSMKSLRKNFDKLVMQVQRKYKKSTSNTADLGA